MADQWTDERIGMLREAFRFQTGLDVAAWINSKTGSRFSRNAVFGKAYRLGLTKKSPGEKEAAALRRELLDHDRDRRRDNFRTANIRAAAAKKRETKVTPVIVEPVSPVPETFLGLTLMERGPRQCAFPRGDDSAIVFCGQPTVEGIDYCAACYRRMRVPPRRKAEAA